MELDAWLASLLVCPRDRHAVDVARGELVCLQGHRYPVVNGVPIMLLPEIKETHWVARHALDAAMAGVPDAVDPGPEVGSTAIDPFVQQAVGGTNGIMYKQLIGRLTAYPIPRLRLPEGRGQMFLDVGCNWGRWCAAAARVGYLPIGIDPSLDAVCAARRVARQLAAPAHYVVGDARFLPFHDATFDVVFSYSVLQHFAKSDVRTALSDFRRVLKTGGQSVVQMPNAFGLRNLYHQTRRLFRAPKDFEVRYWALGELKSTFAALIGPPAVSVDGYFSLNPQSAEAHLLPARFRYVVSASERLRRASARHPAATHLADSLLVTATKQAAQP